MRFITIRKYFIFTILLFSVFSSQAAIIIFDMDGVLVKKSSLMSCWYIGIRNFFGFYNPFSIQEKLFSFLDLLEPRTETTPIAIHNNLILPPIMCDWLCGSKSTLEIRNSIVQGLHDHQDFFYSDTERNLISATAQFIFDPNMLAKVIYPVKDGIKLIKQCFNKKDKNGNRTNQIYILSNWDKESFALIYSKPKIKKIFKYIDGMVISGEVGLMKPDPAIFHYLFKEYNLNPDEQLTVFIDDQKINLQAAQQLGKQMHTIQCKKLNHKKVHRKLKQLAVI
ncbi:MAG: HAD-IA family hydrolase [Candidatus Babeliales bacterium]